MPFTCIQNHRGDKVEKYLQDTQSISLGTCPSGFWVFSEGDSTTSLGRLCQCSVTSTVKKHFLVLMSPEDDKPDRERLLQDKQCSDLKPDPFPNRANTGYIEMVFKGMKRSHETVSGQRSLNPVICAMKRDYSPSVPATAQRNSELLVLPFPASPSLLPRQYVKPIYTIMYLTSLCHLPLHHCFCPCRNPGIMLGK